ncbi:MAG: adenylate/guanylate cyclase domain-containing protein [Gammaproteobacteria bacterium]|nr:adenylate/guanylate cyclase domain-containing protein [Gammaproteobacteria bacterium]
MSAVFQEVKNMISKGEFFKAYDTAMQALDGSPDNTALQHRALLALANAGAYRLALTQFDSMGLHHSQDLDVQCLLARLHKDMGFAQKGNAAKASFLMASQLYEQAWRTHSDSPQAYYPAINAAACAAFSSELEQAAKWAGVVLDQLQNQHTDTSDPAEQYWINATRIEALLIQGQLGAARALVPHTLSLIGSDRTALASTLRQLQRLCICLGHDFNSLGFTPPPTVIHYTGHLISPTGRFPAHQEERVVTEIQALLELHNVGVGYGSLAGGADILFAESLLQRGADLHVVLPFERDDFLNVSVLRCGPHWAERFKYCLSAARSVRMATDDAYLQDEQLFTYCSQIAMGLAILNARHLNTTVAQIGVWDGHTHDTAVGTEADLQQWKHTGLHQYLVNSQTGTFSDGLSANTVVATPTIIHTKQHGRESKAMLFADVKGFSKLSDAALPAFVEQIMGRLAKVTAQHYDHLHSINTWGDGVFAVFNKVSAAAECALAMQESMAGIDRTALGLSEELSLRIGLHLGPVYLTLDPITLRETAIGAHVSRAARIEPVTPEGCVYVTETFAAVLAIDSNNQFACDYVGQTEAAKNYGLMRMFLLRRTEDRNATTVVLNFEC